MSQESFEGQKISPENLEGLLEKLEPFERINLNDLTSRLRSAIERVQDEAVTNDDSQNKHDYVKSCLDELNEELGKIRELPAKIDL